MTKYECPICRKELKFRKTYTTLDITLTETRRIYIFFCANCNQEYIKNRFGEFVKAIP